MYKHIHTLLLIVLLSCGSSFKLQASETTEVYSDYYNSAEAIPQPEQEVKDSEGEALVLLHSEIEMIPVTGRKKQLDSQIVYSGVGQTDLIPEQASFQVEDEEAGTVFDTELPLKEKAFYNERWEDFTFKVTFHAYGADVYKLGETQLRIQNGQPELGDAEDAVLTLIEMDRDNCNIIRYEWDGEVYQDLLGEDCRDALAYAERRVWDCRVLYGREALLPDYKRYRRKSIYGGNVLETGSFEVKEPKMQEEPVRSEEQQTDSIWNRLLKVLRQHLWISIGCGLLIAFLVVLYLLVRLARKAEEYRNQD